jgi:hypothetical protein
VSKAGRSEKKSLVCFQERRELGRYRLEPICPCMAGSISMPKSCNFNFFFFLALENHAYNY